jgi:hypothetical protein
LDEGNKRRALKVLGASGVSYDALYGKPHDAGAKPDWPSMKQVMVEEDDGGDDDDEKSWSVCVEGEGGAKRK